MSWCGFSLRKVGAIGAICSLAGGIEALPKNAAWRPREEPRVLVCPALGRAEIENLQRWVTAGHESGSKDARLVAARALAQMAPDFTGDAMQLEAADPIADGSGVTRATFAWAPLDGGRLYRVTVERFPWLLPIAKDTEGIVWVPTRIEILLRK
jgi:hypothetical protein